MRVFVTGGTGYVGRMVINRLLEDGHAVTTLQRTASARRYTHPGIHVIDGDLFNEDALHDGMRGQDAVVHLVGIIREMPRHGVTMQRIHVQGTQNIVRIAEQHGVRRFLHMSALNSRPNAASTYHKTKWRAECIVRDTFPSATIFRPSVVFGRGGPGPEFVGQLIPLVKFAPITPVVGHGQFKLQPVSVDTVADAFAHALRVEAAVGKTYDLGGPDVLTYEDILRRIAEHVGKPLRLMHVPISMMKILVPLLQRLPGFPITMDQLTMLLEGNVCADGESVYRELSLTPRPFKVVL